jgi:lipopolysaccharide biosynthesis regulator YciM
MEIAKALFYMRSRQFDKAIETLKSYEKKDQQLVAHAATNLSFIYFHEVRCTEGAHVDSVPVVGRGAWHIQPTT